MYTLMVLLALVSMYFFLRLLRRGFLQRATLPLAIGYVLSTTLLLYAHVYGVFVVLAQNVYLVSLLLLPSHRTFRVWHWLSLQARGRRAVRSVVHYRSQAGNWIAKR